MEARCSSKTIWSSKVLLSDLKRLYLNQTGVSESLIIRGMGGDGPQVKIGYIGHIFAFKTSKIVPRDSRDTRVAPNRVYDQSWSFIGPYRDL